MNFREFITEGKSKAGKAVKDLAKKVDGGDVRHVQVLAGKLENWAETGNPSMMADIVKYLAAMDTEPREMVLDTIEAADKSMFKSIMFKLSKKMNEEEIDESSFEVQFKQGMKGTVKTKKFKDEKAFEKWLDKHDGDVEVLSFRDLNEEAMSAEKILGSKPSQRYKSKDQWISAAKDMGLKVKSPSTTPEGDTNKDMYLTAFDKNGNMKGAWYNKDGVLKEAVEVDEENKDEQVNSMSSWYKKSGWLK